MRRSGSILVLAGTTGGVLAAAPAPEWIAGIGFSLLLVVTGLVLLRRVPKSGTIRAVSARAEKSSAAAQLDAATSAVAALAIDARSLPLLEVRDRIDRITHGPLFALTTGPDAVVGGSSSPSPGALADRIALAERRLNRCWSAAVDGYREEICALLPEAIEALEAARRLLPQDGRLANI